MAYPYGQPYGGYPHPTYPGYPGGPPPAYPHPESRSYYYIRSRMNGLVLDVEGDNRSPGARVVMWGQKPGESPNQLWYDDFTTGTIRSKMHDFCLEFDGNAMVVKPYYPGNSNQQWERAESFVRNRSMPNKVLDIANLNNAAGAHLVMWDKHGNTNQCFDFQYVGGGQAYAPAPAAPAVAPRVAQPKSRQRKAHQSGATNTRRNFYIVSAMHNKVLDINGGSSAPGTQVIVWPKKASGDCRNQLWYFDNNGFIRSALHDYAMTANSVNDQVRMIPFNNSPAQHWRLAGNRIMKNNECLDIAREDKKNGAEVISYPYKGSANQHWRLEYV